MQFQQKNEMKAFLKANPQTALVKQLSFYKEDIQHNNIDFQWEKKGKEFKFNGEMYDVINSTISNDSVHFFAIKDNVENKLIEHYASLLKSQTNKKSNSSSILKLLTSVYIYTTDELMFFSEKPILVHTSLYLTMSSSIVLGVVAPPPQA